MSFDKKSRNALNGNLLTPPQHHFNSSMSLMSQISGAAGITAMSGNSDSIGLLSSITPLIILKSMKV